MTDSDATQGDNMSPAEFAKLMGAYPQPAENPLPTYGGYMDNSAANFSWVQNNDYFGAESDYEISPNDDYEPNGKVALTQFVAYDDRIFGNFCKVELFRLQIMTQLKNVDKHTISRPSEMLNDGVNQGRY